jgi:hypothetical protein
MSNLVALVNLPNIKDFSHGSTAADVDGDGDIDIWVNSLGVGEAYPYLMLNNGKGKFTIVADLGILGYNLIVGTNGRLPKVLVGLAGFWSSSSMWRTTVIRTSSQHPAEQRCAEKAPAHLSAGAPDFTYLQRTLNFCESDIPAIML